jgi:hypothetical protein
VRCDAPSHSTIIESCPNTSVAVSRAPERANRASRAIRLGETAGRRCRDSAVADTDRGTMPLLFPSSMPGARRQILRASACDETSNRSEMPSMASRSPGTTGAPARMSPRRPASRNRTAATSAIQWSAFSQRQSDRRHVSFQCRTRVTRDRSARVLRFGPLIVRHALAPTRRWRDASHR